MQKSSLHQGMLLNKNGYWLSNGKQENEWGFMFGRNDRKFGTDFPQEWSIISFNDHGKIQTDNGLFIYSTVYPFPELKPFVTKASALQNYLETKSGTTDGYYWKIVLFLPKTALVVDSFFKQRFGIAVLIIIYLLLGSASYFIAHAILKQKQFQERILKSAADLNQAQKIARLGNWSFDISTNNFEWSQEIYRIFGVDQGKPMSYEGYLSLVYADDVKTVDDAWQITCQGEPHRIIFRTIADGNIKWLEQIAECGFDSNGNIKKIVGTLQDITAIKTTKEYLKRLFDEHKSLIQSIPAGVYKCKIDSSGEVRFEFVSQRFCEILGVREEDALCDFHMVFQGVIQDDQNSLLSAIENLSVSRDRFFWEGQIINNGASCWLRFESGEPYLLDNGDTILSGIVVDMTDHIMAERLDLLQSELLIAQELQASMLPAMPMFSKNREVEICAFLKPAKEISGDFYDAFWLDSKRICIAIGDVVGKGIPAAIYMVHVMTLLRTEILKNKDVLQSIHGINKSLSQDNPMCMFVTLTIGVLDITNGIYQYVNGGHLRPVLGNFRDGFQLIEAPEGMLVGITPQGGYEIAERKLKSGDMLILYTDGITEATNSGKKRFTEQRFLDHLNSQQKKQSVCSITNGILSTVKAFTSTAEQSDDMTLLVLSYNKNQ
jgi:serine phosphatase RsbU (regulator of sigma subunit)/PAS domain-containing protein